MIFHSTSYLTFELSGSKGGLHLGGHIHSHHGEHVRLPRGLKGPHHMFECRRTNIMGSLVQDASPFLFPCTIEYSLICAAILYVMWKNISKVGFTQPTTPPGSRHHAHAYRYSDNTFAYGYNNNTRLHLRQQYTLTKVRKCQPSLYN